MSFLNELVKLAATTMDQIHGTIPAEQEAEISIIISHKGTVSDALVVGDHDLGHLLAVAVHLSTAKCEVGDATADQVFPLGMSDKALVQ